MGELNNILKRSKFENLVSYLIGAVGDEDVLNSYEAIIAQSYETLVKDLRALYKEVNSDDDDLFDAITNFAYSHDDVYLEVGMLVGFQLYKNFDVRYHTHKDTDILKLLEKRLYKNKEDKNKETSNTILDSIHEHRLDTALEETLNNNEAYQELAKETLDAIEQLNTLGLTPEQWQTVQTALEKSNARNAKEQELTYKQGFHDAIKLYTELVG